MRHANPTDNAGYPRAAYNPLYRSTQGGRMERTRTKPERTGLWQILLITAVLGFVIYGAFILLGRTRTAWEEQRAQRDTRRQQIQQTAASGMHQAHLKYKEEATRVARQRYEERQRKLASGELRCINHQMFRKLPNGWENIPGDRC